MLADGWPLLMMASSRESYGSCKALQSGLGAAATGAGSTQQEIAGFVASNPSLPCPGISRSDSGAPAADLTAVWCPMRHLTVFARRLAAAAASRTAAGAAAPIAGQPCAATGWLTGRTLAAAAAGGLAAAACTQWSLADSPQQQTQAQQADDSSCPDCASDIQLEDQPVAISNSATAQVGPAVGCQQHMSKETPMLQLQASLVPSPRL